MRRNAASLLYLSALILWALSGAIAPCPLYGQSEIHVVAPAGDGAILANVIEHGQKLESEHRWGEALTLYEDALHEHPEDHDLAGRHDLAKIHYDLGRRYGDSGFLKSLTTLGEREAQSLYAEVLLKIQSHYVTEPDWQALVRRGTADLDVALADKTFSQRNLRGKNAEEIAAVRDQVHRLIAGRTLRNRSEAADLVGQIARLANQKLGATPTSVLLEYTCGATGALDEYSAYLTSEQLNDVYSQIEGNFVGLGIELKANGTGLLIVKVIGGSPAERAGIKAGDRITMVNGRPTTKMSTDQAANLLQGEEGTKVEIVAVGADDQQRRVSVRREHVEVPSVDDVKILDREYGVGYLKLTCFQKTTSRDLDNALWKLHRDGMKTLVMDLRGNPGGLLTSSVEVADKFIEDGTIVSTRGRSPIEDYTYTAHKPGTWRVPLVVLIDGDSASASEIFAGAIRDHRRGTIVGQRSYGKGSVQGIFPLSVAGAGIRLTTAKFYSPSGKPISHVGVQPDVVVRRAAKISGDEVAAVSASAEDAVISAALQAARRQMAQKK